MNFKITAFVLLLAAPIMGCGEEESTEQGKRGGSVPEHIRLLELNKGKIKEVQKLTFTENEKWNDIKPHFLGTALPDGKTVKRPFIRSRLDNVRDPFEPQLVRFVPKIELVSDDRDDIGEGMLGALDLDEQELDNPPQATELGETQRFRAQDYRPVLIKWGTSVNKALVQDPDGNTYVVSKDMKLGNNNGRVTEITRYEIWVQEDNSDDPLALSIEPEIIRLKATPVEEGGARLFPIAAEK
ncbi:MAG TPA: hypothetical protein EYN06_03400 [Myxococcales bacterium]|nr:hypothetical protein [Myxococcales bacterium]HIN85503.1 hypothetical protein [Myxococcales bacterium]